MLEIKELLDSILKNTLKKRFNLKFKLCFDEIFDDNEYVEYNNYEDSDSTKDFFCLFRS